MHWLDKGLSDKKEQEIKEKSRENILMTEKNNFLKNVAPIAKIIKKLLNEIGYVYSSKEPYGKNYGSDYKIKERYNADGLYYTCNLEEIEFSYSKFLFFKLKDIHYPREGYYWHIRFYFDAKKNTFSIDNNGYHESSSLISEEEFKRILLKAIKSGRRYMTYEPG
jgi:hypothetical protein